MSCKLVYLDSQDFIRLTDELANPKIADLLASLLELKRQGACRFGVSFLHIMEVLNPDSAGFEAEQIAYGQTINLLTDGDSFPFISDAVAGAEYPNDRIWLPNEIKTMLLDLGFVKGFWPAAKRLAMQQKDLNRASRRQIGSKPWMRQIIRQFTGPLPPDLVGLGITAEDIKDVLLDPKAGAARFRNRLIEIVSNPELFCAAVSRVGAAGNPLLNLISKNEGNIHTELLVLMASVRAARSLARANLVELENAEKKLQEVGGSGEFVSRVKEAKRNARRLGKIPAISVEQKIGDRRFEYLDHYLKRVLGEDKIPNRSEIRDLLHIFYCQQADLVRVDKRMYEVMKGYSPFEGQLVRRIEDLPEMILA